MSGKFFWLMTFLIFVLIGHLSYTLFAPRYQVQQTFENAFGQNPDSTFVVLNPEQSQTLFPSEDPNLVLAVCPYDVARGPLKISIGSFNDYWSLSIYTNTGDSFYSINDRQARFSNLSILLRPIEEKPKDQTTEREKALKLGQAIINAPLNKGWAVLRMRDINPISIQNVEKAAAQFSCKIQEKTQ